MALSVPKNKSEFIEEIKRRLGNDYIPVDLSEDNWNSVVMDAITYFSEYYNNFQKTKLVKLEVLEGVNEYTISDDTVYEVIDVLHYASFNGLYTTFPSRELSDTMHQFYASFGNFDGYYMTDVEIFYEKTSMFNTLLAPKQVWRYNFFDNSIFFYDTPPYDYTYYLLCKTLLDYDGTSDGSQTGQIANQWRNKDFLDYATGLALRQWYRNLRKFRGQLPGGVDIDIDGIKEEANEIIEKIEEKVMQTPDPDYWGIIMG